MPRRDLLTYDVDQRRRSSGSGPNPRLVVLLIVVLVLAIVLVIWTARSVPPGSATPAHTASSMAASGRSPTATSRPSASPVLIGSDAHTARRAPRGSRNAAARFIAAWLERDPKTRKAALEETATPGLAEQLMLTSRSNIPKATARGRPVLEHASEYSVQFVQTLSDRMRVRIYLVAEPQARFGWIASSVEQA